MNVEKLLRMRAFLDGQLAALHRDTLKYSVSSCPSTCSGGVHTFQLGWGYKYSNVYKLSSAGLERIFWGCTALNLVMPLRSLLGLCPGNQAQGVFFIFPSPLVFGFLTRNIFVET